MTKVFTKNDLMNLQYLHSDDPLFEEGAFVPMNENINSRLKNEKNWIVDLSRGENNCPYFLGCDPTNLLTWLTKNKGAPPEQIDRVLLNETKKNLPQQLIDSFNKIHAYHGTKHDSSFHGQSPIADELNELYFQFSRYTEYLNFVNSYDQRMGDIISIVFSYCYNTSAVGLTTANRNKLYCKHNGKLFHFSFIRGYEIFNQTTKGLNSFHYKPANNIDAIGIMEWSGYQWNFNGIHILDPALEYYVNNSLYKGLDFLSKITSRVTDWSKQKRSHADTGKTIINFIQKLSIRILTICADEQLFIAPKYMRSHSMLLEKILSYKIDPKNQKTSLENLLCRTKSHFSHHSPYSDVMKWLYELKKSETPQHRSQKQPRTMSQTGLAKQIRYRNPRAGWM